MSTKREDLDVVPILVDPAAQRAFWADSALDAIATLRRILDRVEKDLRGADRWSPVEIMPYATRVALAMARTDAFVDMLGIDDDRYVECTAGCGETPHRFRPSPEAGPYWRCSECGEPRGDEPDHPSPFATSLSVTIDGKAYPAEPGCDITVSVDDIDHTTGRIDGVVLTRRKP